MGRVGLEPTTSGLKDPCATELRYRPLEVSPAGLEPAAPDLGNLCSIHLSYEDMVTPGGLEPPTYGLEGRRSIQLSYEVLKHLVLPSRILLDLGSNGYPLFVPSKPSGFAAGTGISRPWSIFRSQGGTSS